MYTLILTLKDWKEMVTKQNKMYNGVLIDNFLRLLNTVVQLGRKRDFKENRTFINILMLLNILFPFVI